MGSVRASGVSEAVNFSKDFTSWFFAARRPRRMAHVVGGASRRHGAEFRHHPGAKETLIFENGGPKLATRSGLACWMDREKSPASDGGIIHAVRLIDCSYLIINNS
jgi:hypothetical protein